MDPRKEVPSRAKTTKLLGKLGLKSGTTTSTTTTKLNRGEDLLNGNRTTIATRADHDTTLKALQDRMLHKALQNRVAYQPAQVLPRTSKTMPGSNVKPPRGTLSDEKLPYLDWRLSMLMLQQVQDDERLRSEELLQYANGTPYNDFNDPDLIEVVSFPKHKQDVRSDDSYKDPHSILLHSNDEIWQRRRERSRAKELSEDVFAKRALHHALLNSEALATVPLLEKESRYLSTDVGADDDDDGDSNEQYYEVDDATIDRGDTTQSTQPAPLLPASIFYRASFGLRSTAMERSSSSSGGSRKLSQFFGRGIPRSSQSQSGISTQGKASGRQDLDGVTVNNLYYDGTQTKSKQRWNLLALPLVGGSEMTRESELMR